LSDGVIQKLNNIELESRKLNVTIAKPKEQNNEQLTLFVANLGGCTEEQIRNLFKDYKIEKIMIHTNNNGEPKGFSHIKFFSVEECNSAFE